MEVLLVVPRCENREIFVCEFMEAPDLGPIDNLVISLRLAILYSAQHQHHSVVLRCWSNLTEDRSSCGCICPVPVYLPENMYRAVPHSIMYPGDVRTT